MRYLIGLFIIGCWLPLSAVTLPDNMYFRAMNDEMQRSLAQLRLKDHPTPYYLVYQLSHFRRLNIAADMGTVAPAIYDPSAQDSILTAVFISVGSDKQDGLGFSDAEPYSWNYYDAQLAHEFTYPSYEAIRQRLWKLTDKAYLQAADLYKKKKVYKAQKNIQDVLPDVVAEQPAQWVDDIPAFTWPDTERLQTYMQRISVLGKNLPYVEQFRANLMILQRNIYFLNSRGAVAQYQLPMYKVDVRAVFRQPDGKVANASTVLWLKDVSDPEMERALEEGQSFAARIKAAYGAKNGEAYIGPVLLKPQAASRFLSRAVLLDMQDSKPWLLSYADDDKSAGLLYKKRALRVSTDLLTMYDYPRLRQFQGVPLARFAPVDDEGVATQDLTLVENGHAKDFPLSQRPLTKGHHSNGHGFISYLYGPRERLTNIWIEPKETWTDEQMEEKLRARCRELGLEYGYILHQAEPDGDLGIERIYTADGRKETVLNLKWDGNFFTQRDLRGVLAVGGKQQLAENFDDWVVITPSVLMEEVELVPKEHKPHRKPFIAKPK